MFSSDKIVSRHVFAARSSRELDKAILHKRIHVLPKGLNTWDAESFHAVQLRAQHPTLPVYWSENWGK